MDAFYENMDGYKPQKPSKLSGDDCVGQMKFNLNIEERSEKDNKHSRKILKEEK